MSDAKHTPEAYAWSAGENMKRVDDQLGRRFRLCETHRVSVVGEGRPCEICTLLEHKADLLAACKGLLAEIGVLAGRQLPLDVADFKALNDLPRIITARAAIAQAKEKPCPAE